MPTGVYERIKSRVYGMKGKHHTEKTKEKMSQNHAKYWLGKHRSKTTRLKIGNGHLGKHYPKLSKALLGRKSPNLGKHLSQKHKDNISKANIGIHAGEKNPFYGKCHTSITKEKMSKARKGIFIGEKSPSWKGGVSSLMIRIRGSSEYHQWRSDIFTRDDFTCQKCGKRGIYLEAHHKETFTDIIMLSDIKTYEQAMNCDELWNIDNGVALCKDCHNNQRIFQYNLKVR